jgi:hypothetical protein
MSSREFSEWMAYFQLQPFGEWRGDFRMAVLAAQITNVMTRSKDDDPIVEPEAFMPDFEKALDEYKAKLEAEIPEHELLWMKIRSKFAPLVTPP